MNMELDASEPHPNPQPDQHHRKVELQSQADLTFLQQNLAKAARQRLDLHFPPGNTAPATVISLGGVEGTSTEAKQQKNEGSRADDEGEDPLRARVRLLVDAFLKQTWRDAQQNISVNGIDASSCMQTPVPTCTDPDPSTLPTSTADPTPDGSRGSEREGLDFTYAPFDPRLQHKLASLHGELEALTAQVSKLRREAPRHAARTYQTTVARDLEEDEQDFQAARSTMEDGKAGGLALERLGPGWHREVEETYGVGLGELARLAGVNGTTSNQDQRGENGSGSSLTEIVGKAQRARTVAMEFE